MIYSNEKSLSEGFHCFNTFKFYQIIRAKLYLDIAIALSKFNEINIDYNS